MMTVNEVSKLTGVSIRTLHYYDTIGLLHPTTVTESGYRLYDDTTLEQQIELLTLKKEHLENLIQFARGIQMIGVKTMDFSVFDTSKLDEYAKRAKEQWGQTEAYKEFEEKTAGVSAGESEDIAKRMMGIFTEFGTMKEKSPEDKAVQAQVKKLQDFITEHFYNCTPQILSCLGKMYAGGGEFTQNIDRAGGEGTAEFASRAIEIYCDVQ